MKTFVLFIFMTTDFFHQQMTDMMKRDIICIGASAGGVTALRSFVQGLPKDFAGSIFVVLHVPPYTESYLPDVLSSAGPLPAVHPADGDIIEPGKIYVAPNDRHLIVEEGKVMIKKGPRENRCRPAIDALFRSAAYVYRSRVVGIVMSGLLNDGTSGLYTIKRMGGLAIVQDPDDAEQSQMPRNAMEYVQPDFVLSAADMPPLLTGIANAEPESEFKFSEKELELLKMEVVIATRDNAFEMGIMNMGEFTPFTCPECNGAFVQLVENEIIRYRCHTGHAYTASSLLAEVSESVEAMLWKSMRGLEEMNMLLNRIAGQYDKLNKKETADFFRKKAETNSERARTMHDAVFQQELYSEDLRFEKSEGD
jgi:two-component system, chemotaxis family, protein-glutamate methylesterase/glutaminase